MVETHTEDENIFRGDSDDQEKHELLQRLTDDDLLIALRRRGRLMRIEAQKVIPRRYIEDIDNFDSFLIQKTFLEIGHKLAELAHKRPFPGCKKENVVGDGKIYPSCESGVRYTGVLNFVVEKKL